MIQEIPVKIHHGSTYDYHFLSKELAQEFKGHFECFRENTEKYITLQYQLRKNMIMVKQSHTK